MTNFFFRLRQFFKFYRTAVTRYQLHSPFVFELANEVLEEKKWYYAFRDVEMMRRKMLASDVVLHVRDYGVAPPMRGGEVSRLAILPTDAEGKASPPLTGGLGEARTLRQLVRRAASSPCQGRRLFRLVNWAQPGTLLELGTSVGVGAMYLASAARSARFVTLEGCAETAHVARTNLEILGLTNAEVVAGEFDQTLPAALEKLQRLDFVFLDGNHRAGPTLHYFNTCLPFAHAKTVFVFDDAHWSPEMAAAWKQIQQHPRVTMTVDFFDFSLALINPDFREKQHFSIVPSKWKFWKIL